VPGACDNTEDKYALGITGANNAPCKSDCYWDNDGGSGNDDCLWDHSCDPFEDSDPGYPEPAGSCPYDEGRIGGSDCPDTQTQTCHDICGPLTPNGCDCFGCCSIDGGARTIWLGSYAGSDRNDVTCTPDSMLDDELCHPCTQVEDCLNPCGECELCFGRDELPEGCDPGEGSARCPDPGQGAPCGLEGDAPCPSYEVCITGCCAEELQ